MSDLCVVCVRIVLEELSVGGRRLLETPTATAVRNPTTSSLCRKSEQEAFDACGLADCGAGAGGARGAGRRGGREGGGGRREEGTRRRSGRANPRLIPMLSFGFGALLSWSVFANGRGWVGRRSG